MSSDIQPYYRSSDVARPAGRITRVGRARAAAIREIELQNLDAAVARNGDELAGERERGKQALVGSRGPRHAPA